MQILNEVLRYESYLHPFLNIDLGYGITMDKLVHATGIVIIGLLLFLFLQGFKSSLKTDILIVFSSLIVISFSKEIFDLFIKGTFFSLGDLVADFIGIIIALYLLKGIIKQKYNFI